jgi:hypothetical protein
VARTTVGNQVIEMISGFPINLKQGRRADMVDIKALPKLGLSEATKLASVVISLAGLRRLPTPVLPSNSLNIALVTPMIGIPSECSTPQYVALFRAILAIGFGAKMLKGFTAIRANLRNWANEAGIVLARIDFTAKLQETLAATSLFDKRPLGERLTADNAGLELLPICPVALFRTVLAVLSGKFFATNRTSSHG